MRMGLLLAIGGALLAACSPAQDQLDPAKAQNNAERFLSTLFPGEDVKGPICLPNEVVPGETQCHYSYQEDDGDWESGSLLCGNLGCREGAAPALVTAQVPSQGMDEEWLYWYALTTSGGISIELDFDDWKHKTPSAYRRGYYSSGYRPSSAAKTYYKNTYSAPISKSVGTKYSYTPTTKTTPGYKPPSTITRPVSTTTYTPKTVTSPAPAPKPTTGGSWGWGSSSKSTTTGSDSSYKPAPVTSPKPSYKPAPSSRSSGYGTSRSSGGYSSGRRR